MSDVAPDAPWVWDDVALAPTTVDLDGAGGFDAFYAQEYRGLVALARALCRSTPVAEDLAQEAMIAAFRRWDEVRLMDAPAAWVRRVVLNMATSVLRRRAAEARAMLRIGSWRDEPAELRSTDVAFWAQVRRLPRRQAQAVALYYVLDLPVHEVADTLGCSEGTVKAHLARARATLAERLALTEEER